MTKPDRLGQVLVETERPGHRASDPARLQRVGQAGAVVIALGGDEDLCLVLQPAEGLRVDDPVAVALERRAHRAVGLPARAVARGRTGSPGQRGTRPPRHGLALPAGLIDLQGDRSYGGSSRGGAQRRVGVVLERLAHRPLDLAQVSLRRRRRLCRGLASASTMKRCASPERAKEPASQPAQTRPPAAPEKAAEVLGLAAAHARGERGGKASHQGELEAKGQRSLKACGARFGGVVEQR